MHIHFVGIGGIGVSALAKYYLAKGHKVTGSDLVSSEITDALRKMRAKIFIGPHGTRNVLVPIDLVVYSPAVPANNPELKRAKKLGIKCLSYPQALGELTKKYFTIAVSGTHGKSTTTAMIGLLLAKAGLDPTVIVGTKLKEFGDSTRSTRASTEPCGELRAEPLSRTSSGLTLSNIEGSNCRVGESQYLVIEADEHMASFLNYWPKIIVLTAIEADHLDYYKNFKNYVLAYKKFISQLPKSGILIANKDDKNISKLKSQISKLHLKTQNYFLKQPVAKKIKKILKIPGKFNISNALAALTVTRVLKIPDKISFKALSEYRGSWRRFEIKKIKCNEERARYITLVSDYGHHPTEIKVTLRAAREKFPKKKIWCVFQPHQYQRTYYLFKDFVKVFKAASVDKLIITDIYDVVGRETPKIKKKVSSEKLVKKISKNKVIYLKKEEILDYLKKNLRGGEVVMIMGAGDIYNLSLKLKAKN